MATVWGSGSGGSGFTTRRGAVETLRCKTQGPRPVDKRVCFKWVVLRPDWSEGVLSSSQEKLVHVTCMWNPTLDRIQVSVMRPLTSCWPLRPFPGLTEENSTEPMHVQRTYTPPPTLFLSLFSSSTAHPPSLSLSFSLSLCVCLSFSLPGCYSLKGGVGAIF